MINADVSTHACELREASTLILRQERQKTITCLEKTGLVASVEDNAMTMLYPSHQRRCARGSQSLGSKPQPAKNNNLDLRCKTKCHSKVFQYVAAVFQNDCVASRVAPARHLYGNDHLTALTIVIYAQRNGNIGDISISYNAIVSMNANHVA
eukprot:2622927-Amphidinium_carterae.1